MGFIKVNTEGWDWERVAAAQMLADPKHGVARVEEETVFVDGEPCQRLVIVPLHSEPGSPKTDLTEYWDEVDAIAPFHNQAEE